MTDTRGNRIRILLAEDHLIVRQGLQSLLEKEPDLEIVGQAETGREAVRQAGELLPDVIVMDLTMPELNGMEATRRILADHPGLHVIVLTMHSDKRFISEVLKGGAKGYLLKEAAADELVTAIRAVAGGGFYLCRAITGVVVKEYLHAGPGEEESRSFSLLTPREREVLQLIAEGKSTKEIAFDLGVSVKTIESQRQQIMRKLNLHSVAGLTKYAIREGLTSLQ